MRTVTEAKDVTEDLLEEAVSIVEGWYPDGQVDWVNVWDRMEQYSDLDLGTQIDSPAMRKIKRYVRSELFG